MIQREVFQARLGICQSCEFWKGVCLKGHALQSPVGCPVRKFEPVEGASYHPDRPVPVATAVSADCCGQTKLDVEVKPMTWGEAWQHFVDAMAKWKKDGRPVLEGKAYSNRVQTCKGCPGGHFHYFQCDLCKCLVYTKALLPGETCPKGFWPAV
jgi:hypothetical protein